MPPVKAAWHKLPKPLRKCRAADNRPNRLQGRTCRERHNNNKQQYPMKKQYQNSVDREHGNYRILASLCECGAGVDIWTVQVRGPFGIWCNVKRFESEAYVDVTDPGTPLDDVYRGCWSPEHIAAVELFESLIND